MSGSAVDDPVHELRTALIRNNRSDYDSINAVMQRIAKAHEITGQKLHDLWVAKYDEIPDTWIARRIKRRKAAAKARKKLEERAEGDSVYGYWIPDRGAPVVIGHGRDTLTHVSYLKKPEVIKHLSEKLNRQINRSTVFYNDAEDAGWIRVVNPGRDGRVISVDLNPNTVTRSAIRYLIAQLNKFSDSLLVARYESKDTVTIKNYKDDLRKFLNGEPNNLLFESDMQDPTPYGYWILKDGSKEAVPYEGHMAAANKFGRDNYADMYDDGAIRVVNEHYSTVWKQMVETEITWGMQVPSRKALRTLRDLIKDAKPELKIIFECGDAKLNQAASWNHDSFENYIKFLHFINKLIEQSPSTLEENTFHDDPFNPRGKYGAWIDPNGKLIDVTHRYGHDDVAKEMGYSHKLSDSTAALDDGCIRIRFLTPGRLEIEWAKPGPTALLGLQEFLRENNTLLLQVMLKKWKSREELDTRIYPELEPIDGKVFYNRLRNLVRNYDVNSRFLEEQVIGFNELFFNKVLENLEPLFESDQAIEHNSYGAWISKEGDVFAVHNEMEHMRIANTALKAAGTYDALNNGAIRLIFGRPIKKQLSFEIRKPSRAAQRKLTALIERYGFETVVAEWHALQDNGRTKRINHTFDIKNAAREKAVINDISNLVKSQIPKDTLEESYHSIIPRAEYGYWISPKGKYFKIDTTFGHARKAREIIEDYNLAVNELVSNLREEDTYNILFDNGYIRVMSNTSSGKCNWFGVQYGNDDAENIPAWEALKNLIRTYKSDTKETKVFIENERWKTLVSTYDWTKAIQAINQHIIDRSGVINDVELDESTNIPDTEYGYWILPDGEFLSVPVYGHSEIAKKYICTLEDSNPSKIQSRDPYIAMFILGCIRVVVPHRDSYSQQKLKSCSLHFDLDTVTKSALRSAIKLARSERVEKIHIDVHSQEEAYFSGSKLDGLRKLNDLIPTARPYVVVPNSDTSDDEVLMERQVPATEYGYWILPYGEILVVDHMAHISVADEYLSDKEIEHGQYDQYDRMFDMGAIRVIIEQGNGRHDGNTVVNFQCDPATTTKQAYDDLLSIIRSYKPDAVFKDRWMHDNFWAATMREGISRIMELKKSAPRYEWPFDDDEDVDSEHQLLEADIPDTSYGYWILPDGRFEKVNKYNHVNVARRLFRDEGTEYYHMFEIGAIRIVSEHKPDTLEVEYTRGFATRSALRSLLQLINYKNPKDMYVDERVKYGDKEPREMHDTTDPIKIARLINQLIPKSPRYVASDQDVWASDRDILTQPLENNDVPIDGNTTEVLDEADIPLTSYGYWILPNGHFEPVEEFQHLSTVQKLLNNSQAGYSSLFSLGAIRIVSEWTKGNIEVEFQTSSVTRSALRALLRLIKIKDPRNVIVSERERPGEIDKPKKFENLWRTKDVVLILNQLTNVAPRYTPSSRDVWLNKLSSLDQDPELGLDSGDPGEDESIIDEASGIPNTEYGYWILPNGNFVSVEYQAHSEVADGYFPNTSYTYESMFEAGAIRVVCNKHEVSLELDWGSITKSALRAAKRLIIQIDPDMIVCDSGALVGFSDHSWSGDKRKALINLEQMIQNAARYTDNPIFDQEQTTLGQELMEADIPDTDYGYWITPQGHFLPVKYQMHADVAIDYLADHGIHSNILNCYDLLFEQGFIRILLETYRTGQRVNYQYQEGKTTRQALRALIRLLRHLQPATVASDGFPMAAESNLSTDWRKVTASLNELIPAAPKAEEVQDHALMELRIPETEYGYWIMPDGDLVPVTIFDHDLVAKRITGLKSGAREELMRSGAIRVVSALTEDAFEFEVFKDSRPALKALAKLLRHVKPERIIGDWGSFTVMGDWKKVSRQIEKYLEEGQDKLEESQQLIESVSFHPSVKKIVDGEIWLSFPEATSTTEESCPYCHNGKIHWSENDVRDCEMCKGTGIFHEPVYDFPELSVSNRNAGVIQEMLGLEPDYSGYIDNKDIPIYIRHLIRIINTGEVEKFKIDSGIDQQTIVDKSGDIPTIRRGAQMIDLGLTKDQLIFYATKLLEIFKYAQKLDLHVSWA